MLTESLPGQGPGPQKGLTPTRSLLLGRGEDKQVSGEGRGESVVRVVGGTAQNQRLTADILGLREGLWAEAEAPREAWINS